MVLDRATQALHHVKPGLVLHQSWAAYVLELRT